MIVSLTIDAEHKLGLIMTDDGKTQDEAPSQFRCGGCDKMITVREDGRFYHHRKWDKEERAMKMCQWSGQRPFIR
jgi:hypothetical protein